jgi:Glycosyl hydrolase family 46
MSNIHNDCLALINILQKTINELKIKYVTQTPTVPKPTVPLTQTPTVPKPTVPVTQTPTVPPTVPPVVPVIQISEDKPSEMILKLVCIAENSSTDWKKQINYIENIGDGRGYTISIVGFCTGTGDFIQVLQEIQKIDDKHPLVKFIPLVKDKRGGDVSGLSGLPAAMKSVGINDATFNSAMWKIIKKLYWGPSLEFCRSKNLSSQLAKYIVYDTCLNFGELDMFNNLSVAKNENDEKTIIKKFLDIKQRTIENDGSLGDSKGARTDMQKVMLAANNMDLNPGFSVTCYGDTFKL